jgi:hypothetical protein
MIKTELKDHLDEEDRQTVVDLARIALNPGPTTKQELIDAINAV